MTKCFKDSDAGFIIEYFPLNVAFSFLPIVMNMIKSEVTLERSTEIETMH